MNRDDFLKSQRRQHRPRFAALHPVEDEERQGEAVEAIRWIRALRAVLLRPALYYADERSSTIG